MSLTIAPPGCVERFDEYLRLSVGTPNNLITHWRDDRGRFHAGELADDGEAYLAIQKQGRQRRKSKKDIAEAIIIGEMRRSGQND